MMSTDVLFARLALIRENGMLTQVDEALKSKLTSSTYVNSHSHHYHIGPFVAPFPFPCPVFR